MAASEVKGTAENINAAAIMWKIDQLTLKADELPFLEPESSNLKPLILQKISQKSSVMPYCQFFGSLLLLEHSDPEQQLFGFIL